jgi:hypothetical protein
MHYLLAFFVGIGGFRSVITGRVVDADTTTHPIILKAQTKIFMMVPLFLGGCLSHVSAVAPWYTVQRVEEVPYLV